MKLKHKLLLCSLGIAVGITLLFYFANFLFLSVSQSEIIVEKFKFIEIIESMKSNRFHGLIFLTLIPMIILSVFAIVFLNSSKDIYKSELDKITEDISTPKAIGQFQHGSARWLTDKEKQQAFATFELDSKKYVVLNHLLKKGIDDYNAIEKEASEN